MIAARHITIPIQNIGEWWIRLQSRPGSCGFIQFTSHVRFSHGHGGQIVGSTENRSPALRCFSISGLPASSRTASTRADDGPRRHATIMAATTSAGPANSASTLPSRRLRTQPSRSRAPRLVVDKGAVADALHQAPDRHVTNDGAHCFFKPRNSLARAFTSASRIARPVNCADGNPFNSLGGTPSRNAFNVS